MALYISSAYCFFFFLDTNPYTKDLRILFFFFLRLGSNYLIFYYFFFFKVFIYLFILFMAVLGLRFCARAFSSCGKRGPLFIAVRGPLSRPLSLQSTGSRRAGSAIVAHGPSCSAACGILPDQGSNPYPPHWQADSQPLRHQGSPKDSYYVNYLKYILQYIFPHVFTIYLPLDYYSVGNDIC